MTFRKFALFAAFAAALSVGAVDAYARPGGGSSVGSRGAKTYTAPPSTRTAPNSASPIERSVTPQSGPSRPGVSQPSTGGFGRGLMGGLLGGLLGAGLFGMLFGHGLMGGMGGIASFLGLLLQIGLIVLVVRLALNFFRNRQAAGAGAGPQGAAYRGPLQGGVSGGAPAGGGFGGFGGGAAPAPTQPLQIVKDDYDAFERRLADVQQAYSAGDIGTLRRICTPEIAAHLEQELADNAARGVTNKISNVRLLQGDLAESWREPSADYATVAMRFALNDVLLDKASGRVVSGSPDKPEEVTELWTFRRAPGSDSSAWTLSAMQQAA